VLQKLGNHSVNDLSLLSARSLSKAFHTGEGWFGRRRRVPAVESVSFDVSSGETLALVGESGSGKTTTVRLILRLLAADSGSIRFDGVDWLALPRSELNSQRRKLGIVFQDPSTSLNPRMSVGEVVSEPLDIHRIGTRKERRTRVEELLSAVGMGGTTLAARPSEFSGGQRQRIAIARALAARPRLMVLDEPVSALDVSVRGQILNLLKDLQEQSQPRPAYLFVGHDLSVVRHFADRTLVMYLGRIVENGPADEVLTAPAHPYTALLRASEPGAEPGPRQAGEPASLAALPPGCAFHPRCRLAREDCRSEIPHLTPVAGSQGREVACFHPLDTARVEPIGRTFQAVRT
jgi:oligopeptide/dipeptide ABC transporter ATP-binding protein